MPLVFKDLRRGRATQMEIRRNAVPWPLKGCVAVREKAMYAAVRCGGSEVETGVREALQVFVRRISVGARHVSRTKARGRDSQVGGATRRAGEKRLDRRPTGSGSRRDPLPKGWQADGTSNCVNGRASVFSQTRSRRPGLRGPGSRRLRQIEAMPPPACPCSPPQTSNSSIAVKPKPNSRPFQLFRDSKMRMFAEKLKGAGIKVKNALRPGGAASHPSSRISTRPTIPSLPILSEDTEPTGAPIAAGEEANEGTSESGASRLLATSCP
jgi:hypothetical protein